MMGESQLALGLQSAAIDIFLRSRHDVMWLCVPCVLMSTHASIVVDSVGPQTGEVCRTAASFP